MDGRDGGRVDTGQCSVNLTFSYFSLLERGREGGMTNDGRGGGYYSRSIGSVTKVDLDTDKLRAVSPHTAGCWLVLV